MLSTRPPSLLSPGSKGSCCPTSLWSLFMPQKVRSNKSKETTGATKHCDVYQSIRTIYPLFCLNKRWILLVARKCFTSEGEKSNSSRMLKTNVIHFNKQPLRPKFLRSTPVRYSEREEKNLHCFPCFLLHMQAFMTDSAPQFRNSRKSGFGLKNHFYA